MSSENLDYFCSVCYSYPKRSATMNFRRRAAQARHLILFALLLAAASCGKEGKKSTDLDSLLRTGQEQMQKARYREAVVTFEKATRLHPYAPEPYLRLALLYEECLPDPATALRYYRKYQQVEKDPVKREEVGGWVRLLEQRVAKANNGTVNSPGNQQGAAARTTLAGNTAAQDGSSGVKQEAANADLQAKLEKALQELEVVKSQRAAESGALERLAAAERTIEQVRTENESLAEELRTARARIQALESGEKDRQIAQLTGELQETRRQLVAAEAAKARADEEIAEMKKAAATYAATLSALQRDYDKLKRGAATPKAAPVVETNRVRTHTVRAGETLKSIAASRSVYGDSGKWILLYQANKEKIRDPNKLIPGQVLVIPPG